MRATCGSEKAGGLTSSATTQVHTHTHTHTHTNTPPPTQRCVTSLTTQRLPSLLAPVIAQEEKRSEEGFLRAPHRTPEDMPLGNSLFLHTGIRVLCYSYTQEYESFAILTHRNTSPLLIHSSSHLYQVCMDLA
jgi:hypothetical protein